MEKINRKIRTWIIALSAALLLSSPLSGAEIKATYIAGNYVASPAAEFASHSLARYKAYQLASTLQGAYVVRGRGRSMLPLYQSGTFLVVQPRPFEELTRGMSVVFHSRDRYVTHILVAKTKDGWRTTGLNNRRHDYVPVNEANIRGVVVAAFTPAEGAIVAMR